MRNPNRRTYQRYCLARPFQPTSLQLGWAFLEAMRRYAGLETAYRRRFQGRDGSLCQLYVLDDGLTWQLDFPELGRGVVYRLDAVAGKGLHGVETKRDSLSVKLRGLASNASYRLSTSTGPIQMNPTDSSVGDFTSGAFFPMVHEIRSVHVPVPDELATGRDVMEDGFKIPDNLMSVCWLIYQQLR